MRDGVRQCVTEYERMCVRDSGKCVSVCGRVCEWVMRQCIRVCERQCVYERETLRMFIQYLKG